MILEGANGEGGLQTSPAERYSNARLDSIAFLPSDEGCLYLVQLFVFIFYTAEPD